MKTKETSLFRINQVIQEKDLFKVTTIKKSFTEQMEKLSIENLKTLENLNVIGWYKDNPKDTTINYEYALLLQDNKFLRVDVYILCSVLNEIVNPKLYKWDSNQTPTEREKRYNSLNEIANPKLYEWDKNQTPTERKERYNRQRELIDTKVEQFKKELPQIFTN